MPEQIVESFQVKRLDILDQKGNEDGALVPSLTDDQLKRMYELLVLSRTFDQRALQLQREGRLGTYPSFLGQEASQVGSVLAAEKPDWIFPSFRESGVYIAAGYPLHLLFQYWAGDERGLQTPDALNVFPICVPVGTDLTHAAGAVRLTNHPGGFIGLWMSLTGRKRFPSRYLTDAGETLEEFVARGADR